MPHLESNPHRGDRASTAESALVERNYDPTFASGVDRAIHEIFEDHVRRSPRAIAAMYEGCTLTYSELNGEANQIAHYLRGHGVQPGEFVPILMSRSTRMLIAQLAVLKCGGAYVPVDPSLPAHRRAFMMKDCLARTIITEAKAGPSEIDHGPIHCVDCSEGSGLFTALPTCNLDLEISPRAPAYVMYTSGSTGTSKGIVVPHRAVGRLVINSGFARIGPTDCFSHCSNPAFDASTFEIWGALLNGARVAIATQSTVLDSARLASFLKEHHVSITWLTVGLLSQHAEGLSSVLGQLRYLITGGDTVPPELFRRVLNNHPPQHLLNAYGPTECTTFSITHRVESQTECKGRVPIGRPIASAQIYILDPSLRQVPVGNAGEIFIGGPGLASGYLNRPELTGERFVANPFDSNGHSRMYRSGDLARWRPDGAIEFLGRNDQQVKLRGYRIEPGEIEAQLARHEMVREASVAVREDTPGDKRLVAYITHRGQIAPSAELLRVYLSSILPEYMVPSAFVSLDALPLTANGKVDRKALPPPAIEAYAGQTYAAPQTAVESALAAMWAELLPVDRIGRFDHFFDLGGDSLIAMRLVNRVTRQFRIRFHALAVFRNPTLCGMAQYIESINTDADDDRTRGERQRS